MTMEHIFAQPKRAKSRTYGSRTAKRQQSERDEEVRQSMSEGSDDDVARSSNDRLDPTHLDPSPSRSAAGQSVRQSPRTPSKRTRFSQSVSPSSAASSSSPKVKLDLRRDVMELLSPRKDRTKRHHASAISDLQSEADPDDGSEEGEANSQSSVVVRQPSKMSFASRMAPKRARGHLKRDVTPPPPSAHDLREARGLASPAPALGKAEAMPQSMLLSPSRRALRKYGTVGLSDKTSRESSQRTGSSVGAKTILPEPTVPADTHDLKARWDILDEMESDTEADGSANLRSILHLRYSGEQRRFADDFDYLTMNLGQSSSQNVRQNTCMEILKLALGWETDIDEHPDTENLPPIVAAHQTPFLINLRNTHLTERLYLLLRQAGCGDGRDAILDTAFAILCCRTFCDSVVQLEDLPIVKDTLHALGQVLSTDSYEVCAKAKARESKVLQIALDCNLAPSYCSIATPQVVAGQVMNLLLSGSINTSSGGEASRHLSEVLASLTTTAWKTISQVAAQGFPLRVEQVALLDVGFNLLCSLQNTLLQSHQVAKIVRLVQSLSNEEGRAEHEGRIGYVQCLSSSLRFLVFSTQQSDEAINCQVIASDGHTVQAIGNLIINATRISTHTQHDTDIEGARWLDIAALALGILTGLLERAAEQTKAALLDKPELVKSLGRLFSEQNGNVERHEEPQARMFSGCLAVALSLLVLMDADRTAFELLARGMRQESWQDVCHSFSDCLDNFLAMTLAIKQKEADAADSARQSTPDNVVTGKEARELMGEDNLVRNLIQQLRTLSTAGRSITNV